MLDLNRSFLLLSLCRKDAQLRKERDDKSRSAQEMKTPRQTGTERPGSAACPPPIGMMRPNRIALLLLTPGLGCVAAADSPTH